MWLQVSLSVPVVPVTAYWEEPHAVLLVADRK
jgi:hypothetical protein